MKNIGLGQQTGFKSGSHDADTHIDILPKTQTGESPGSFQHLLGKTHVKTPGMKFFHRLFLSTYTSRSKKGGHRIINGFLYIRGKLAVPPEYIAGE